MEKIKRFISCYIPVTTCTFRCHYCYITHHRLFGGTLPNLRFTPEEVRKALSQKRLGGACLINFCGGGETLLPSKIVDYVRVLLEEGHYVMIVTNGIVTNRFKELALFPQELLKRLFFKFSYHFLELKSRNLFDEFFSNVKRVYDAGASFTLEATPSDELIPYIDEVKEIAIKNAGAVNHITVARDERVSGELPILTDMSREDYNKTWSVFNSSFFDYKMSIFGERRKEFCYAGAWSAVVDLGSGMMKQCYCSFYNQNIFKDLDKPIRFLPVGNNCKQKHCYNGHAFLALGVIPELKAPSYGEIRNRITVDGKEWLRPAMKEFMETKLYGTNQTYTSFQKRKVNIEIRFRKLMSLIKSLLFKIKRFLLR